MTRRLATSLAFVAVCLGVAVVPSVIAQMGPDHYCCSIAAAGGVTSLNTETGDITLTSTGGSVTITPSGNTIDLSVVGGSGVSAVTGSGNIAVSAGATPNVTITDQPIFPGGVKISVLPTASPNPGALLMPGSIQCEGGYIEFGNTTTGDTVAGVDGTFGALGCTGAQKFTWSHTGSSGQTGFAAAVDGFHSDITGVSNQCIGVSNAACGISFDVTGCYIAPDGSNKANIELAQTVDSTSPCALILTSSANKGEVTCSTSVAASCTATATVTSGAACTASMLTSDSTLSGPYYAPTVDVSTTTLTVTMTAVTLGTGNLAAEYHCV